MKNILILILVLWPLTAYAGAVANYYPDVVLIETRSGILETLRYLVNEVDTDLPRYSDETIKSFIDQCKKVDAAIWRSSYFSQQEKLQLSRDIKECNLTFSRHLRTRLQLQYDTARTNAEYYRNEARKAKELAERMREYLKTLK